MSILELTIKIFLTSLLALITLGAILFLAKDRKKYILEHKKVIYFIALFLIILSPFLISLYDGKLFSNRVIVSYVAELSISIILVTISWVMWVLFNKVVTISRRDIVIGILRLLLRVWQAEPAVTDNLVSPSNPAFALEIFKSWYPHLENLVSRRFIKTSLDICQVKPMYYEKYIIFCDEQKPNVTPVSLLLENDPEIIKNEKEERLVNFVNEDKFFLEQLGI